MRATVIHSSIPKTATACVLLLLALPAGLFAGTASELSARADEGQGAAVADVDLLTLDPKMAKFLVEEVGSRSTREARLNGLLDAIFSKKGLDIKYGNTRTKTAAETFEDRSGNCLSFTFLFVSMARHLGLRAYFMEVAEALSWDQRGEIVVSNQHMFAEVEIDNAGVRVDFLPGLEKRYFAVRRISDQRALAHYYNNLGAELLASGEAEAAMPYFHKALAIDPELSQALVNQGFALRRRKDFEGSERSYLRALEIRPGDPSASANLASLYLARGRRDEADPLLRRVESYQQRNPFHHFRQARNSAAAGDHAAAIKQVKEAIRRDPGAVTFHATLADYYAETGDTAKAVESLQRALRLAEEEDLRAEVQRRLLALQDGKRPS